jgi:hypothetical protein
LTLFFRRLYSDISAKSALEIVQTAISEVNEQNDGEQAIDTALETVLLGPGGVADSSNAIARKIWKVSKFRSASTLRKVLSAATG